MPLPFASGRGTRWGSRSLDPLGRVDRRALRLPRGELLVTVEHRWVALDPAQATIVLAVDLDDSAVVVFESRVGLVLPLFEVEKEHLAAPPQA